MAKRFTDSNKYKKTFIRGLQGAYKLLWDFLYHDCDHAGIWIVDFKIAQYYIGEDMPVNMAEAIKQFNEGEIRVVVIDSGKKWFIPSFIEFQYGKLSRTNKAHNNVIPPLLKYHLIDENLNIMEFSPKEPVSPLQGDKEKDKEKEEEQEKEIAPVVVFNSDVQKPFDWGIETSRFLNDSRWRETVCMSKDVKDKELFKCMKEFVTKLTMQEDFKDCGGLKKHFINHITKHGLTVNHLDKSDPAKVKIVL